MITLTNPIKINNSIGGVTTLNYDIFRVVNIVADPVNQIINAQVQLRSSSNASAPLITGNLFIQTQGSPVATLTVGDLGVFISMNISTAISTIQGWITSLQNSIESGLISESAVVGTQSTGV